MTRAGVAILYAAGAISASLFLLAIAGVEWSPSWAMVSAALALVAALCGAGVLAGAPRRIGGATLSTAVAMLIVAATLVGYAFFATAAPLPEWDFWAIWGLKGRVFLEARGIDWPFLEQSENAYAHPDYPLLLPLQYAFVALLKGAWDDRMIGLLFALYALALLLIVHGLAAEERNPRVAAFLTIAFLPLALTRFIGLAEGPFIAFSTAGILLARAGRMTHAAILLGLAASTKNEGLALLVAVALALLIAGRARDILRLWPAAAIVAPWLILSKLHGLGSDLTQGSPFGRILHAQPARIAKLMLETLPDDWHWLLILAAIPVSLRHLARERFAIAALAIQFLFILAAYLITPHDVEWHILTSWPRVARQLLAPAAYVAMMLLAQTFARGEESAHAEARPQH